VIHIPTQRLLPDRNHGVVKVGGIVDKNKQFVCVVTVCDMFGEVDCECSVASTVSASFFPVDLLVSVCCIDGLECGSAYINSSLVVHGTEMKKGAAISP
jgi:hypothetical protein